MYLAYNIILVSGKQYSEMTCIHCEIVITINLDTICYLTKLIQCYCLYFPCYTLYLMTYFIAERLYSVPLSLLPHPNPTPHWQPPIYSLINYFEFCFFFILSTYNWNHLVCFFRWLISLSTIPSRVFHVLKNGKISFFLYMSNILLWVLHTQTHTHALSIHQWHLGSSYTFAIVNNGAVNIMAQVSFWISVSFSVYRYPAVELPEHMVALIVWRNSILFSILTAPSVRIVSFSPCPCQTYWSRSVVSNSLWPDPMDCSLPGSSVHGIFQARVLASVAISFSFKLVISCLFW